MSLVYFFEFERAPQSVSYLSIFPIYDLKIDQSLASGMILSLRIDFEIFYKVKYYKFG